MPITFEQVSYSYETPSKKKGRGARKAAENTAALAKQAGERTLQVQPEHSDNASLSAQLEQHGEISAHPQPGQNKQSTQTNKPAWGNDPHATWALQDIDFTLEDGEFFGIAGHTGSGKSTLIQHMNGLIHPTFGRVLVNGHDVTDKKVAAACRSEVGVVFQYPEHQLFAATVYDDVAFGPRNMGLTPDEVDERVRESLSQVDLDFDTLRDKSPFELSGGQQRRVAFAGVLAMRPTKLILDEPVAGLDPAARSDFLDLISDLHKNGLTVVMVSHTMDDLARLCDRILVLKEGAVFQLGTPSEVFSHADALSDIGLGVPQAQQLANALKAEGVTLTDTLYDTLSLADALTDLYRKGSLAEEPEEMDTNPNKDTRTVINQEVKATAETVLSEETQTEVIQGLDKTINQEAHLASGEGISRA